MIEKKITCDHCHREKGETNHWWVVNALTKAKTLLYVMRFDRAEQPEINQGAHACSRECAHKIIEQWMSTAEGL